MTDLQSQMNCVYGGKGCKMFCQHAGDRQCETSSVLRKRVQKLRATEDYIKQRKSNLSEKENRGRDEVVLKEIKEISRRKEYG